MASEAVIHPHRPTTVLVAGGRAADIRPALGEVPDLRLVTAGTGEAQHADIEVVLYAPAGATTMDEELATLRARTDAPVIVAARTNELQALERALTTDIADVVVLPQTCESLQFTIHKVLHARDAAAHGIGRITTVFSPKGGTGKTVVAANLASALAARGLRTLLVDLDLEFGDAAIALGVEAEKTLHELLMPSDDLDGDKLSRFVIRVGREHHLGLLAAPHRPELGEEITEAQTGRLLDVARTLYDAIVIDTAPSFDGAMLAALEHSDELLLLCGPDVPTVKNVLLGLQTLEQLAYPTERISIVYNRAGAKGALTTAEIEGVLRREIRYTLPEDAAVAESVNRGRTVVKTHARAPFARALDHIAAEIAQSAAARRNHHVDAGRRDP